MSNVSVHGLFNLSPALGDFQGLLTLLCKSLLVSLQKWGDYAMSCESPASRGQEDTLLLYVVQGHAFFAFGSPSVSGRKADLQPQHIHWPRVWVVGWGCGVGWHRAYISNTMGHALLLRASSLFTPQFCSILLLIWQWQGQGSQGNWSWPGCLLLLSIWMTAWSMKSTTSLPADRWAR